MKQRLQGSLRLALGATVLAALAALAGSTALAQDGEFAWQEIGESAYANCVGCHQANGAGVPGVFPPLAEHMPTLVAVEGGREYLIRVILYGLQGPITVLGQQYNGLMPAWPQLSDEEVAAVLNHESTSWGNDALLPEGWQPFTPDEVAALRGEGLDPAAVHELRMQLELPSE